MNLEHLRQLLLVRQSRSGPTHIVCFYADIEGHLLGWKQASGAYLVPDLFSRGALLHVEVSSDATRLRVHLAATPSGLANVPLIPLPAPVRPRDFTDPRHVVCVRQWLVDSIASSFCAFDARTQHWFEDNGLRYQPVWVRDLLEAEFSSAVPPTPEVSVKLDLFRERNHWTLLTDDPSRFARIGDFASLDDAKPHLLQQADFPFLLSAPVGSTRYLPVDLEADRLTASQIQDLLVVGPNGDVLWPKPKSSPSLPERPVFEYTGHSPFFGTTVTTLTTVPADAVPQNGDRSAVWVMNQWELRTWVGGAWLTNPFRMRSTQLEVLVLSKADAEAFVAQGTRPACYTHRKVYLAGGFGERNLAAEVADLLRERGWSITCAWWKGVTSDVEVEAVRQSDILVVLDQAAGTGTAAETGMAIAQGKPIVWVTTKGKPERLVWFLKNYPETVFAPKADGDAKSLADSALEGLELAWQGLSG